MCSVAQSFLTLCNPMDCSLPGSFDHGISQARVPEWVAISFCKKDPCKTFKHFLLHLEIFFGILYLISLKIPHLIVTRNLLWHGQNIESEVKIVQSCPTLCNPMDYNSPWNSPGQNTAVGSCYLLQGIFPTQGSNPGLLHCRKIPYQLSYQGSPKDWKRGWKTCLGTPSLSSFLWDHSDPTNAYCHWWDPHPHPHR